jgi:hypothetical protein
MLASSAARAVASTWQPNTIDEAFTLYDDTEIVFGN